MSFDSYFHERGLESWLFYGNITACRLFRFYQRVVFDLQHRQHLAYEVRRVKGVKDLIPP